MISLLSLILIIILSILITRIATIMLVHTGLSRQIAAFQARSAFTGVGFTTNEAENVVDHPVRRKVIMTLMLIGNAGIISAVASLMLTFIDVRDNEISPIFKLMILIGSIIILWFIANSKVIDKWFSKLIDKALRRYTKLELRDYAGLLHLSEDYQVSELSVREGDWLANKKLINLQLRAEGINVIGITRKNGQYIGIPKGETVIKPGDTLLLYGKADVLEEIDKRQQGDDGERQHQSAINKQQQRYQEQEEREREDG